MLLSIQTAPTPLTDPIPIAVLASGRGSNLAAIHAAIQAGELSAQIVAVLCNEPGAGVITLAEQLGLRCIVMPHRGFVGGRAAYDAALAQALRAAGARWVIMAGWMRIVTDALIDAFPGRILNLHPSLLPSFPGLHAHQQALDAGVRITGCTVHRVVADLAAVCVSPEDSPDSLIQRIHLAEHALYPRAIALALSLDHEP
jgi:phosphoribosylglycinamide formyltransferase 1